MRMNPATKMMVMSDRYGRANNGGGGGGGGADNTDRSGGRATPRTNTERGHTYDRSQDMARDNTRYGRDRNASRSYGYDPDIEVNQRGPRGRNEDEDGEEWRGERQQRQNGRKAQRMYAAGMAWTDDEDEDEEEDEKPRNKKRNGKRHEPEEVDEHHAREWVKKMKNADGSPSPHYDMEKAETLRKAHCPECEKWEWYVALNMMYSDYCEVAKKMSVHKEDFYTCMAKAFLMDEDAVEDKLAKYMEAIPKD